MEGGGAARLGWGGKEGMGGGGRECGGSVASGPCHVCLAGLRRRSPAWGRVPRPLLRQPQISIRLDWQEINGGHQSADALQDLVKMTGPCSRRLLPHFVGRKLLAVLFFVLLFFETDFRARVTLPLGYPFCIRLL